MLHSCFVAFLWEYCYKRLKLVQLLDQLGVTFSPADAAGAGSAASNSTSAVDIVRPAPRAGSAGWPWLLF
jgi:hypothetical protein